MGATTPARGPGRRGSRNRGKDPRNELSREDAAGRITAFVYGNILVLAALIALHPADLEGPRGVAYVVGTAVSTFVAHVLAESVGARVRNDIRPDLPAVVHNVRDAVPVLSSATVPGLLLVTALLGWLNTTAALQLALGVTVLRLAALGWVVGWIRGERASMRTFLSGILLAAVCASAAVLKWWLTH
jgi:hypothetical protein